ncbi:Hypothetical predicted protein, partial [Paramuricea clavata]
MAASTSAQILPYLNNKCYLHIVDDAKCDIKPLTSKRLETLVKRIEDWKGLYGKQLDIALILERKGLTDFVDINSGLIRLEDAKQRYPDFGFHEECYQKFTNISIINKARRTVERKRKMEEEPAVPPSKPKMPFLRSKVPKMSQQPHTILPKLCIICKKLTRRTKIKGKWVHESLSKAETSDAGQLRSAAEKIDDETILKDIRGKDCSCIEVQYHKSCYNDYVRVLKGNDSVGE